MSTALLGASNAYITISKHRFFDSITVYIGGNPVLNTIITAGIIFSAVIILNQVFGSAVSLSWSYFFKRLACDILMRQNLKSVRLDPIDFENPKVLDDIERAGHGIVSAIRSLIVTVNLFMQYIPCMFIIAVYLFSLRPILAISLVIIFIPVLVSHLFKMSIYTKLEDKNAPLRREMWYYESCISSPEYYRETRILGCFRFFYELYMTTLILVNKKQWEADFRSNLIELVLKMITLAGYMGVFYLLFDSLFKGIISIGAFAAVFYSIGDMFNWMEQIISQNIGTLMSDIGTISNLVRFLDLPERKGEIVKEDISNDINAENISFKYPGKEEYSIQDVTLHIKSGEIIAIVGENGAGKSTLVKLLTGLYHPEKGSVNIGGYDTYSTDRNSIYKNISGVFQKYQRYGMTLKDNLEISDIDSKDKSGARLDEVRVKADINIENSTYPNGYETMLSRDFEGVELSGGQWQRVAIGRGFYRKHNIIVLDEPTAAIDPLEESRVYKNFSEISKGKTGIIITHRLGSARIADRIAVMQGGKIAEIGNHDDLVEAGGLYSRMWHAQAQYYV
ncbi:MAG: ABC transporter ATP-binding protein [Eubacteriales bacterium]